ALPRGVSPGELEPGVATPFVELGDTGPAAPETGADHEAAAVAEVAGAAGDHRHTVAGRHERQDVAGHHHDVEASLQVEDGEVPEDPRQLGMAAHGARQHLGVGVDPDDVDAPARQLGG